MTLENHLQMLDRLDEDYKDMFGLTNSKSIADNHYPIQMPRRERIFENDPECNTFTPDVNKVLQKLDANECLKPVKILHNPFKQELRASNQRLAQVRRGVPLMKVIPEKPVEYPLLEEKLKYDGIGDVIAELPQDYKAGLIKKVDFVIPVTARPVRPPQLSARLNSADLITKRIQRLMIESDKMTLKFHNEVIANLNHANQRRTRVMKQFNSDLNKYGYKEASRRAKRAAQKSRLRIISRYPWWAEFIEYAFSQPVTSEENKLIHEISETTNLNGPQIMSWIKKVSEEYQNPDRSLELILWINTKCKIIDENVLNIIKDQGMFKPEVQKTRGLKKMTSAIYN